MPRHRRALAPLWVYLFGLFALGAFQAVVFPPEEHSTAAAVAFFAGGAIVVTGVLTVLQRRMR
jgi:hypothetical protein